MLLKPTDALWGGLSLLAMGVGLWLGGYSYYWLLPVAIAWPLFKAAERYLDRTVTGRFQRWVAGFLLHLLGASAGLLWVQLLTERRVQWLLFLVPLAVVMVLTLLFQDLANRDPITGADLDGANPGETKDATPREVSPHEEP